MAALASSSASAAEIREDEIAFFDVETSAPPRRCVLLEFGAVVVCPRRLVEVSCFATLVRPADPDAAVPAARCNGITRDAVARAPPFRDVADTIYDVLHGECPAMNATGKDDAGRKRPHANLCTTTGRMASLADYFGLGRQRHRSLDDVRMNLEVLKYCATVLFLEANPLEVLAVAAGRVSGDLVVSHGEEMMLESTMQIGASPSGYSGFVEPDDVSTECIKISVSLLHHFGPRTSIQHKGAQLQLSIPTTVNGDTAPYATHMYQKGRDGVISKLVFRKVDAAELESLLRGNKVDAFFSLEMYDYQQNAGIRLVAKRLDVHFK
ncbi:Protein NEN1 [Dichanthelium oligosanthes]|uniref:Protein NEN1 n=1 Tax=Dichanthelium oligosanthes TaxID=888268 RepID=A0A1E5ULI4_9POAL|nr:Protein NEN1 [Dichanthelium oligosanthes]